jgi:serine/threonine protein kinase
VYLKFLDAVSETDGEITSELKRCLFESDIAWNFASPGGVNYTDGTPSTRLFCKTKDISTQNSPYYSRVTKFDKEYFEINFVYKGVLYTLSTLIVGGTELLPILANSDRTSHQQIILRIMKAVAALHETNILHCDLKPENIMVVQDKVVITDFEFQLPVGEPLPRRGTPVYAYVGILLDWQDDGCYKNEFKADLWSLMIMAAISVTGGFPYNVHSLPTGVTPERVGNWWDATFETWLGEINESRQQELDESCQQDLRRQEWMVRLAQDLHTCVKSATGTLEPLIQQYNESCNCINSL